MPIAIGIDLGTTRTAVGIYLNGEINIIPMERGKRFMPSYVAFTETHLLVGDLAEDQLVSNPKNTIFAVKRFIGRRFDDPIFQEVRKYLPYETVDCDGKPKISVTFKGNKMLYDPEEITAMILNKIKQCAEVQFGHQITDTVITVPSSFNDSQRQATIDAGKIAGLNVLHILNEPMAAAIAYGLDRESEGEKTVLVCDLGSGAFDASVLKIKQGKSFEVQATVGDANIGGIDFDFKLVHYAADDFLRHFEKDVRKDDVALRRLKIASEAAKKELDCKEETILKVENIVKGADLKIRLNRSKFEEMCEPLFNRIMDLLQQALLESGITKEDIDDVVLVGGSSRILKVKTLISDLFDKRIICSSIDPDESITYGAAIQAAALSGYNDKRIRDILFLDVTPLSIGIEASGGAMMNVIERNSSIPCKASHTVTTFRDNQFDILIQIFEGERPMTADNHLLGKLELVGLPPLPRGVPQINVNFEIDSDGILKVSTDENEHINRHSVEFKLDKGRLSIRDIRRKLQEAEEFRRQDEEGREIIRFRNALEHYVHSVKRAVMSESQQEKLSARDKLEIHKICNETHEWLLTNPTADKDSMVEKRKTVIKLLQPFVSVLNMSFRADSEKRISSCSSFHDVRN